MPLEPKHFFVDKFTGRLGIGLSPTLEITDIPESSPCFAASVPKGVCISHINGVKVGSHADVRSVLSDLQAAASIVVTVKPKDESQAEWWATVRGTIEATTDAEDDAYDPDATEIDHSAPTVAAKPSGATTTPAATAPAAEPYGLKFQQPSAHDGGSEPSDYNSDVDDEEQDWWAPPKKRAATAGNNVITPMAGNYYQQMQQLQQVQQVQQLQQLQAAAAASQPVVSGRQETSDGLHPCVKSGKRCHDACQYRNLPSDACVHFMSKGSCNYQQACKYLHCKPGAGGTPGFPYKCEPCGLGLTRRKDLQNHTRSKAHDYLARQRAATMQKEAGVNNGARSLLARISAEE